MQFFEARPKTFITLILSLSQEMNYLTHHDHEKLSLASKEILYKPMKKSNDF
jgi:hypothetical protein